MCTLRRDIEHHHIRSQHLAITHHRPTQLLVIGLTEEIVTVHLYHQRRVADQGKSEKLLRALGLIQGRMRRAVGEDQPVQTELSVVRFIAKIAAVGPEGVALFVMLSQGLVHPVPHKTTLQARMFAESVPVFSESAKAVAHRVGIFAEDQRTCLIRHTDPLFK
ncbi:hypothetical protein D3C76_1370560 [compost metagenome]